LTGEVLRDSSARSGGDEQVLAAVVVEVARGHPGGEAFALDPGRQRHVGGGSNARFTK
jgi:hypothetical protein